MLNAIALLLLLSLPTQPANYGVDSFSLNSPGVTASGPDAIEHANGDASDPYMVARAFVYGGCLAYGAMSLKRG